MHELTLNVSMGPFATELFYLISFLSVMCGIAMIMIKLD